VLISSILIVLVSELSKRSSMMGSIFASVPLISVLAMIWLYNDTKDIQKVVDLSQGIFWLVIPSLSMFLLLPALLQRAVNFYLALLISIVVMVVFYFIMITVLAKLGIKI
jgi:hypothetical protein